MLCPHRSRALSLCPASARILAAATDGRVVALLTRRHMASPATMWLLGSGVIGSPEDFGSSSPGSSPGSPVRILCPRRVRTFVRARPGPQILRAESSDCRGRIAVLRRNAEAIGDAPRGRQSPHVAQVRRAGMADLDKSFRARSCPQRRTPEGPDPAEPHPGRSVDVFPWTSEGAAVQGGVEGARV